MKQIDKVPVIETRITTALLLAAGTGSRLSPLTDSSPKCLTEVAGIPMLERLLSNLHQHQFRRLVVVVGHLGEEIKRYLDRHAGNLVIDYVVNPVYDTTNNIYSLWVAREAIREPFLLIESDLIFDSHLLNDMLSPNQIAISDILPWMNGTTVTADRSMNLKAFHIGAKVISSEVQYKTVNIYSLSSELWSRVGNRLDRYIRSGRVNEYYEVVFKEMAAEDALSFHCVKFDNACWYEVDTLNDLDAAQNMFSKRCERDHLTLRAQARSEYSLMEG